VTFSNPVEGYRGRVLLPGSYVFKLAESSSDRHIVEIYTDKDQFVTTVLAVADYRSEPPSKTVMTFSEGRNNSPEELHEWFYPGNDSGLEFVYPAK